MSILGGPSIHPPEATAAVPREAEHILRTLTLSKQERSLPLRRPCAGHQGGGGAALSGTHPRERTVPGSCGHTYAPEHHVLRCPACGGTEGVEGGAEGDPAGHHRARRGAGRGLPPLRPRRRHGLVGWVRNSTDGVRIEVEGPVPRVEDFRQSLEREAPPAARVARAAVPRTR
ncbi:acylphosphatase [Hyalangium minutum]|uniref:acylphosphatase n=1 Tax=Hyalangium minutum TaxID=394096 RepID=UPI001F0A2C13|nr:acylphosphatase [Hyalangium minutum]